MLREKFLPLISAGILLAGCGNNQTAADSKTSSEKTEAQPKSEASANDSKPARSDIKLTVTGGDMAGSYEAVCRDACCSYGIAGDKVFGNQYSETGKGPKELSSVQMIVDDVTGDKSTKEFTMTVSFGELFGADSKSFTIDTRNGKSNGSGTLDLQYSTDKATVKVKGVTKDNVQLDLDMECNKITTMESIQKGE